MSKLNMIRLLLITVSLTAFVFVTRSSPTIARKKITIVLVHGAFADSSSWNAVISKLYERGYGVVAAANPLRGLKYDSDSVSAVLTSIQGPIVLVGHSYGGSVITNAASGHENVKALVYVDGFAPDTGENALTLSSQFPRSILGAALTPVPLPGGGKDLYIRQEKFHSQFAADIPEPRARLMFATQRPVAEAALAEATSFAAWKTIPSWFMYGNRDKNIPPALEVFMAERARAKETVEVNGGSHAVMISHPSEVAKLIERAATP